MITSAKNLLRPRNEHEHARVTYIELFFDLVFVFAVTQLSHGLLAHLTLSGALETGLLMMAVWWVWIYTSWITNWLDPDLPPVRVMLLVLTAAGLVLSSSIPQAFGERAIAFAVAYVLMQVGRSVFMLWALHRHDGDNFRNFQRITIWSALAGLFWLAGAFAGGPAQIGWWAAAVAIEYMAPAVGMWVPGLGRSKVEDWTIDGAHLAERCALFIIIALGESVLVTGATFSNLPWTGENITAFAVTFASSVTMWLVYFNVGAERASRKIAHSHKPGELGRNGYTYLHILIVAGIIVTAVGDELTLTHPGGHAELKSTLVILGGPALYLAGNALFKRLTATRLPLSHLFGLGLLVVLVPVAWVATPLVLSGGATAVLMLVTLWEWLSLRRRHLQSPDLEV